MGSKGGKTDFHFNGPYRIVQVKKSSVKVADGRWGDLNNVVPLKDFQKSIIERKLEIP